MRQAARAAVCSLVVAALAAPGLWATTAVEMSIDDMSQSADAIVSGRCTNSQSAWMDGSLVTLAKISVSEVLKGQVGSEITVVLPGGIDSNRPVPIAMTFPAAPEIQVGENTLLFLVGEEVQGYGVVGFSQGKFTVVEDSGAKMVTQDLSALNLHNGSRISRGSETTLPYEDVKRQVQRSLTRAPRVQEQ
jgi:hypothetical protein